MAAGDGEGTAANPLPFRQEERAIKERHRGRNFTPFDSIILTFDSFA